MSNSIPAAAFGLNLIGGSQVNILATPTAVGGVTVATVTFLGGTSAVYGPRAVVDGMWYNYALNDGNYQLSMNGALLTDAAGSAATSRVDKFFRFFGDADGNRTVNATDYTQFRLRYGRRLA